MRYGTWPSPDTASPFDDDRTVAVAREWLGKITQALGVSRPAELKLADVNVTRNPHGGTVIGVDFAEHYRGFAVKHLNGPRLIWNEETNIDAV